MTNQKTANCKQVWILRQRKVTLCKSRNDTRKNYSVPKTCEAIKVQDYSYCFCYCFFFKSLISSLRMHRPGWERGKDWIHVKWKGHLRIADSSLEGVAWGDLGGPQSGAWRRNWRASQMKWLVWAEAVRRKVGQWFLETWVAQGEAVLWESGVIKKTGLH